jgi:hypothetical protein
MPRCPYVYRARCESDDARRRVWIGAQSLAHLTEWAPPRFSHPVFMDPAQWAAAPR